MAQAEPTGGAAMDGPTGLDGPTGPTAAALDALRRWLSDTVGAQVPVVVEAPRDGERNRVCVWPLALLPDQPGRGVSRPGALRLRLRYLVAVDGPVESAAVLVDRILAGLAEGGPYHLVLELVPAHLWGTGGRMPGPALQLEVPVRIDPPAPTVPRVRHQLRLAVSQPRTVRGRVLGPGDVPLAGMALRVPATGALARSGAQGEFILYGLPAGAVPVTLTGHGMHLRAEIGPDASDGVVIHCEPEGD